MNCYLESDRQTYNRRIQTSYLRESGAHLVSMNDKAEVDYVGEMMGETQFWIG